MVRLMGREIRYMIYTCF